MSALLRDERQQRKGRPEPKGPKYANGIDVKTWNPTGDEALSRTYDANSLTIKNELRAELLADYRRHAAADFLLMPSRYEPCGLGQMISHGAIAHLWRAPDWDVLRLSLLWT